MPGEFAEHTAVMVADCETEARAATDETLRRAQEGWFDIADLPREVCARLPTQCHAGTASWVLSETAMHTTDAPRT